MSRSVDYNRNRKQPPHTRRRKKRPPRWTLENPRRLAWVLGGMVAVLLLICILVIKVSEPEPDDSNVQMITPEDANPLGTDMPAESGRITGLEGIRDQVMGFFGSVILSNSENYPHDPENTEEEVYKETVKPDYKYCVVLDAGHGGEDSGNVYGEVEEKPLVLDIAQEVQAAIQKLDPAIEVILTRESDVYMELTERAEIANEEEADLFVSIHCDLYTEDLYASGVSCQYWDSEEPTERGQRSKEAAETIAAEMAEALQVTNYGAWNAVMEVLYETQMPSVALQFGFLSNDNDRMMMQNPELRGPGVEALAESIVNIVNSYK